MQQIHPVRIHILNTELKKNNMHLNRKKGKRFQRHFMKDEIQMGKIWKGVYPTSNQED